MTFKFFNLRPTVNSNSKFNYQSQSLALNLQVCILACLTSSRRKCFVITMWFTLQMTFHISDRKHIFSLKAILWVVKLDFEFELTLCKNMRCQFQSAWTLTFLSSLIFHGADWPRLTSHWHSYSVYRFSYATIYGQAEGVSNEVNSKMLGILFRKNEEM